MKGREIEIVVVDDPNEVAAVVGKRIAEAARDGGSIVLTGGKTPKQAYEQAAKEQPDWSKVDVWWGDERCVPPEDENSNYKLAQDSLLSRLDEGPHSTHRIKGELGKEAAASEYEQELGETELDLLLLGIGPDGHVASLFPHAPTLRQRKRVLPAEPGFEPFVDRVTLSLPTLRSAKEILFIVAGSEKADATRRAFVEEPNEDTPSSLVRARSGRTTAVVDRAAAAGILG